MKALFSLNSLFNIVPLEISEKLKLFDVMVAPILNYGSEIWGFHNAPDIERVHINFLKQLLGVRSQTSNIGVYGELGRLPFSVMRRIRIIKYWFRIIKNPDSLTYKCFMNAIDVNGNVRNNSSWAYQVKSLLNNLGFSYLWNNSNVINIQIERVIERIIDQLLQSWYSQVDASPKLGTYKMLKSSYEVEKYICSVSNANHRKALTRLRCSAHKLAIEEGRFRNIDRNLRLCVHCNMNVIENEYHFVMVCPKYRHLRQDHLPKYYYCSFPTKQKLISLMKSDNAGLLKRLAKFVYLANELRNNID